MTAQEALSSSLRALRLRARLAYVGGVCGRWAVDHNSDSDAWFHMLVKGDAWLHSPRWPRPEPLAIGDVLIFLPHAPPHYLSYSADELVFDAPGAAQVPMEEGSSGFVCGLFELDQPRAPWWRLLPGEILVRRREGGDGLARLVQLLVDEARAPRVASDLLLEHLLESCLLLVIRHCVEGGLLSDGMLSVLADRRLQSVLDGIHREPGRAWTLAALCERSSMSKTVLSERFHAAFGCAPMEYLKAWRMQLAAGWLREGADTIDGIAARCGYDSTPAFSRAFRQFAGVPPGAYRRGGAVLNGATRSATRRTAPRSP
ncbi:MAG: AraC family transcriptional regulator [Gammaproteobacteria bacterium]|nr:AraC family transcriptional regulator [Gammaproteobacteria bacterium]